MGSGSTISRAVVQSAGEAYRLPAAVVIEEFKLAPVLHSLLRYTHTLITQMSQKAVCNRHHSLDQQLWQWLLLRKPNRLATCEFIWVMTTSNAFAGSTRSGLGAASGRRMFSPKASDLDLALPQMGLYRRNVLTHEFDCGL